jgi:hypothetical protein
MTTIEKLRRTKVPLSKCILEYLKHHPGLHQFSLVAKSLNAPLETVMEAIGKLARDGKNIHVSPAGVELLHDLPTLRADTINVRNTGKSEHHVIGVTGDNHLGSKYSRLDVIEALFDIWKDQGVTTVLQCGNIIDGECRFNRFDLEAHGLQEQTDYLIQHWPHRKGMVTEFVTGDDHEGWYVQREGVNIGEHLMLAARAAGREDLVFVGHMERQIEYKAGAQKARIAMIHAGGGTAYAISYTDQKLVESYQGGEKPTILLTGHFHKFNYGYPREVHAVQVGTTMDQSPFMRKKKIQAMVGGVTLEFDLDHRALIHNTRVTWHPFYDRDFYKGKLWKYHWKND